jgi:hypothetical protein
MNSSNNIEALKSLKKLSHDRWNINLFEVKYEKDEFLNKINEILIKSTIIEFVDITSQLSKVDNVFRLLKLNHAFVTEAGRVVGVVTRENLRVFLGEHQKHPTEKLKLLITSTMNLFKPSRQYTQIN